uniref:Uncharacterized protein n=1 Tax=Salmonella phage vB_SEnST11_KE22 TaxID=3161173 RepID=A0AAU8GFY4_9CAUD
MGYPGTVLHRKSPSLGNTPPSSKVDTKEGLG